MYIVMPIDFLKRRRRRRRRREKGGEGRRREKEKKKKKRERERENRCFSVFLGDSPNKNPPIFSLWKK